MSTTEPQSFFSALAERALARARAAPALVEVTPLVDRGWRLSFRLADASEGEALVEINAVEADLGFDYSYVPAPADAPRQAHLDRVGHMLCQALRRLPASVERPALVTPPSEEDEEPAREHVSFWLAGDCDRNCEFCSVSLMTPAARASAHLPILGKENASFEAIEAQLRANVGRADEITLEWSGQDCLLSPDFEPGLRLAYELGYREMGIQTPGSRLIEPGFVEFLCAHSVVRAGLTAHAGDAATFDRSGGKDGAHAIFWQGLDKLLDAGFDVALEVPCTARTVDGLPAHLARLADTPCKITCFFYYPSEDMNHRFAELGMAYGRAIEALRLTAERVPAQRVAINGIPECVRPPELAEHFFWSYADNHMVFLGFERVPACEGCAAKERCPGPTPVYLQHHDWPGQPVT